MTSTPSRRESPPRQLGRSVLPQSLESANPPQPSLVSIATAEFGGAQFREALERTPAFICLTRGPEHAIELLNEVGRQWVAAADAVGRPLGDVWPGGTSERVNALDRAYRTGEQVELKDLPERIHGADDAAERFLHFKIRPLKDAGGRVYGLLSHAVDVTDDVQMRKRQEDLAAELERSNRELDSFAYAASHDLRAPLRGIANLAQWIEEDLLATDQLKPETREMLELMRGRMHRMEALIEGMLQYSRAGRVHQQPESINIGVLVREVVDLLSPPPDVSIVIARDLPTISTERLLLQQVFMNLIGNAIKHAGRERVTITVSGRRVGPYYELAVSDDGPGIPAEFHERIWGIFQTLEARDRVEGAGIGLALVKKIVESQSGRVWVESTPGNGATFKFLWRK